MDLERFNRLLLESVGVGLALVDAATLEVRFHNRRFGEWFPAVLDGTPALSVLLPTLDCEGLAERVADGTPWVTEVEAKVRRRTLTLAVTISPHEEEGRAVLVLEATNVTKMKELEYMVESYSKMVEKQTRDLRKEKERVEKLLLNIMPRSVYEEWKTFGVTTPQRFDAAAVLMLDFVGFTEMAISRDPTSLIAELNDVFTAFDRIVEGFGGERIKTLGDAYIAVCGVPESGPDDGANIARIALRLVHYLERRNAQHAQAWRCRVGINIGPVIGSVIGVQKYVYDIFGPGANLAARMEQLAEPMEILLCDELYPHLRGEFHLEARGEVEVKGFGARRIWALLGGGNVEIAPAAVDDPAG